MIIELRFYDKKTEALDHETEIEIEKAVILSHIKFEDERELYCLVFDINKNLEKIIIDTYPELRSYFDQYDAMFIGR